MFYNRTIFYGKHEMKYKIISNWKSWKERTQSLSRVFVSNKLFEIRKDLLIEPFTDVWSFDEIWTKHSEQPLRQIFAASVPLGKLQQYLVARIAR